MWNTSSRTIAARKFEEPVVAAFYDKLPSDQTDCKALIDAAIQLPTRASGYRFALFIGATASGKTTLLRQLLGTDINTEKFPSTAPGRTTVAQMEFILATGDYEVAAAFMPREEVRDCLEDCASAAGLAIFRNAEQEEIYTKLLVHVDERFRLSYILGSGDPAASETEPQDKDGFEIEHDEVCTSVSSVPALAEAISCIRTAVQRSTDQLKAEIGPLDSKADDQAAGELIEQALDQHLRADPAFDEAVKILLGEITKRTAWLESFGTVQKTRQGWPTVWTWKTAQSNRKDFIRKLSRLTSNHFRWHGTLLTPLVTYLRLKGEFRPSFLPEDAPLPQLVFIDTEGLGHITDSTATVPSSTIALFPAADIILLVDSAVHRMLAGPAAVLNSLATSGFESKLALCFTHFDDTIADNLPTIPSRRRHVFASVEQVLSKLGKEIGPSTERSLRNSVSERTYYVSSIDKPLDRTTKDGRFTEDELRRLLVAVETKQEVTIETTACPVYEITKLVTGVQRAILEFHEDWSARFGMTWKKGIDKQHWTRIRALSRRCANNSDHYAELNPGEDLSSKLLTQIKTLFEFPKRWEHHTPENAEADAKISKLTQEIGLRVRAMVADRMYPTRTTEWGKAYNESGLRSASRRVNIITGDIYTKAAPSFASPEQEQLLAKITEMLKAVAVQVGAQLT